MVYQHDPRHVDVLVKGLRVEHGNSVQTPAVHGVTDEGPEPADQMPPSKNRSQVARCLFFSQNRADMTSVVNVVTAHEDTSKLKRPVNCLERERQLRRIFSRGKWLTKWTSAHTQKIAKNRSRNHRGVISPSVARNTSKRTAESSATNARAERIRSIARDREEMRAEEQV